MQLKTAMTLARVGCGECNESQHGAAVGFTLGFLRHPNLRLDGEMLALSAGQCGRWNVFLHRQSRETAMNLLVDHRDLLRAVVQKVHATHPFHIDAM
jgi:hypothetical protein